MTLSFDIVNWSALAAGLATQADWTQWAKSPVAIKLDVTIPRNTHLPMMMARRLNKGSRLAVEVGLQMLASCVSIDALVFSSMHSELERNLKILQIIAARKNVSPTDFTMSVHNAAVGSMSIAAGSVLPASSISAGVDSFQQALIEVHAFLASGYDEVLLVDSGGNIPAFYLPFLSPDTPNYPYAIALVLRFGKQVQCTYRHNCGHKSDTGKDSAPVQVYPQSMQFLRGWLGGETCFEVMSDRHTWQWRVGV